MTGRIERQYSDIYLRQYWPEYPTSAVAWTDNAVLMLAYQEAALAALAHNNGRPARMLDISTGPALAPLLAMLPAVSEVQLTDFEESNRVFLATSAIEYWRNYVPMLTKAFIHPERNVENILARLNSLRLQHRPLAIDLFQEIPLPETISPLSFDIVSMQFVADSVTTSATEYQNCLGKVCRMVKIGGCLIMSAVVDSTDWQLGEIKKPSPNVSEEEVVGFLNQQGLKIINLNRSMRFSGLSYSGGWITLAAVRT